MSNADGSNGAPHVALIHCHNAGRRFGCYAGGVDTPSVDEVAQEGVQFNSAFCTAPQCSPSRSSMLTGTYPHRNGVLGLAHLGWELHEDVRTLPGLLADAGYETHTFGVEHSGIGESRYDRNHQCGNTADEVSRAVESVLDERSGGEAPFFFSAGFFESHRRQRDRDFYWTYDVPGYDTDPPHRVDVPGYLPDEPPIREELGALNGMIRAIDDGVERILRAISANGLREETLVIFTSDHGIEMPRAMGTCYDPGIEIALLMRFPGDIPAGITHDGLVSNLDIVPTILDIADVPVPSGIDGRSLCPAIATPDTAVREQVFAEMTWHDKYNPMRAVRTERYKYVRNFGSLPEVYMPISTLYTRSGMALLEECYADPRPAEELYDLERDPLERNNLANDPEYDAIRADLRSTVTEWMTATEDPIRDGDVPPPQAQLDELKKYPFTSPEI